MWKIVLLVLALLYVISPYDLFPDMAVGWGWIDDVVILGFLWRYLYLMKKKRERIQRYYQSGRQCRHRCTRLTHSIQFQCDESCA